jgi:hypothetical protein
MSKNQIEEMARDQINGMVKVLEATCDESETCICNCDLCKANALYNAGYRKQIESEWQVTVLVDTPTMFKTGAPHCKNCKGTSRHRTAFCPHCGALMKGAEQ